MREHKGSFTIWEFGRKATKFKWQNGRQMILMDRKMNISRTISYEHRKWMMFFKYPAIYKLVPGFQKTRWTSSERKQN